MLPPLSMLFERALGVPVERVIEVAPEQWWAVFFPIWPDLAEAGSPQGSSPDGSSPDGSSPHGGAPPGEPAEDAA